MTLASNRINDYHEYLLNKSIAVHSTKNAATRYITTITFRILKSRE